MYPTVPLSYVNDKVILFVGWNTVYYNHNGKRKISNTESAHSSTFSALFGGKILNVINTANTLIFVIERH